MHLLLYIFKKKSRGRYELIWFSYKVSKGANANAINLLLRCYLQIT